MTATAKHVTYGRPHDFDFSTTNVMPVPVLPALALPTNKKALRVHLWGPLRSLLR